MAPFGLGAVVALAALQQASSCSIVAVGREASATGYPFVSHTDDGGAANDFRLVRVPRKQWPPGSVRSLYLWQDKYPRLVSKEFGVADYYPLPGQIETHKVVSLPQPAVTWAYWDFDYGIQNEWGLSIGETTGNAKTAGWARAPDKPYGYNAAGIEDLMKIALERCKTAVCAAQTMGDIAVEHGFYSADSGSPSAPDYLDTAEILVLADTKDVWLFNVMTGEHNSSAIWAAKRLKPDHVAILADSFSFSLDLNDHENNMYSEGVEKLAEKKGWRKTENEKPGEFDFFLAYGAEPTGPVKTVLGYYVGRRIWRGYNLLVPEEGAKLDPKTPHIANGGRLPTSVPAPKGSITLDMIINVHRDHLEGTPFDLTQGMAAGPWGNPNRQDHPPINGHGQWERAFSLERTVASYVLQPRPNGRSITWFSYDAPHGSPYLPFYGAATDSAPKAFTEGDMSVFNRDSMWWACNLINSWSNLNFKLINGEARKRAETIETEAQLLIQAWEIEADAAEKGSPADFVQAPDLLHRAALDVLTNRNNDFLISKVAEWWRLSEHLIAKYTRFVVDYTEGDEGRQVYPDWWLTSPEVGFSSWRPDGPYHGIVCKAGETCGGDAATGVVELAAAHDLAALPTAAAERTKPEIAEAGVQAPPSSVTMLISAVGLSASMSAVAYAVGRRHGRVEGADSSHGYAQPFLPA